MTPLIRKVLKLLLLQAKRAYLVRSWWTLWTAPALPPALLRASPPRWRLWQQLEELSGFQVQYGTVEFMVVPSILLLLHARAHIHLRTCILVAHIASHVHAILKAPQLQIL